MRELQSDIQRWTAENKGFAIARVIQTWGSSPRPVGSALLVSADAQMAGSVSGGCVEGHVLREAGKALEGGTAKRLSYGVSDDEAWSVGLTCGGKVQVFLQPWAGEAWSKLSATLASNQSAIMITRLADGPAEDTFVAANGTVTGTPVHENLVNLALSALSKRVSETVEYDGSSFFLHVFPRRSQMLIIGAAHITADLVQLAHWHDFETVVIDPRGAFADKTRFTTAPDVIHVKYPSEVLNNYPLDSFTYAVILSHDPKIDDDALHILLKKPLAYIGALGSRKTHEKRVARLKSGGFTDEEIARIESPIGMDIYAQGAREIALAVMGSVVRAKNQYL